MGRIFYFCAVKIIPAIDLIDGKCVRLTEGDYATSKTYNTNPLEVAKMFEDHGIQHLHLVDLDGAKAGHIINWKVLETIASKTKLIIDFGGGIKTNKDLSIAFECGAKKVTGGSIAIKNPELFTQWLSQYPNQIILGADVKNREVAISGWLEKTNTTIDALIDRYLPLNANEMICTDISRDGKLQGPNFELYKELQEKYPTLNIIASGGVSKIEDVDRCAELNLAGVIIGKAIYEGFISLSELQKRIVHAG